VTTLTKNHARVVGGAVLFDFPAKSGRQAQVTLHDRAVAGSSPRCSSSAAGDCSPPTAP
jgi:DNA topoisomerase IB